jgi:hypothetical protein
MAWWHRPPTKWEHAFLVLVIVLLAWFLFYGRLGLDVYDLWE